MCSRYESAQAAAKIIKSGESEPVSEVDLVEDNQENSAVGKEQAEIDRVGASNFSSGFRGRGGSRGLGRGRGCWTCGRYAGHVYRSGGECEE